MSYHAPTEVRRCGNKWPTGTRPAGCMLPACPTARQSRKLSAISLQRSAFGVLAFGCRLGRISGTVGSVESSRPEKKRRISSTQEAGRRDHGRLMKMRNPTGDAVIFTFFVVRCRVASEAPVLTGHFLKTIFTTDDGLPSNIVNAISQTPDGVFSIGTPVGLMRFDGHQHLRSQF